MILYSIIIRLYTLLTKYYSMKHDHKTYRLRTFGVSLIYPNAHVTFTIVNSDVQSGLIRLQPQSCSPTDRGTKRDVFLFLIVCSQRVQQSSIHSARRQGCRSFSQIRCVQFPNRVLCVTKKVFKRVPSQASSAPSIQVA